MDMGNLDRWDHLDEVTTVYSQPVDLAAFCESVVLSNYGIERLFAALVRALWKHRSRRSDSFMMYARGIKELVEFQYGP